MTFDNFNDVTTKWPYTYRRNPLHDFSFVILKQLNDSQAYQPIGDYTVIDKNEDKELSEKKVMNLVALMNDREDLIDLRDQTQGRLLFYRAPTDDPNKTRIVFYTLGVQGVSVENAVLSIEEELEDA